MALALGNTLCWCAGMRRRNLPTDFSGLLIPLPSRPSCRPPAGTFPNQIQKGFEEPRLLITTDPRTDHQSIKEAAYMNIPVIAFCDTDSDLQASAGQGGWCCG